MATAWPDPASSPAPLHHLLPSWTQPSPATGTKSFGPAALAQNPSAVPRVVPHPWELAEQIKVVFFQLKDQRAQNAESHSCSRWRDVNVSTRSAEPAWCVNHCPMSSARFAPCPHGRWGTKLEGEGRIKHHFGERRLRQCRAQIAQGLQTRIIELQNHSGWKRSPSS